VTFPSTPLAVFALAGIAIEAVAASLLHFSTAGLFAVAAASATLLVAVWLLATARAEARQRRDMEERIERLGGLQVSLLSAILRTLDLRDRMTARHSAAVARYSRELAAAAGMPEEQQDLAHTAGLLHDIGKFILPDHILKGNTQLTEADWAEIRRHPHEGARIVSQVDHYQPVGEVILAHHERIDGLGYPRGLAGDEIPEIARLIAVVDCYDAMTARDSYRRPIGSDEAIIELRRVSGSQLDPRFVELFIGMLENRDLSYRHGQDADLETALAISNHVRARTAAPG